MPVVINSVEVSQEQAPAGGRGSALESPAVNLATAVKPDPEEVRRLIQSMVQRQIRIEAH